MKFLLVLFFFLILFIVIAVHELGHALAAKLFKIKIKSVSFGLGKPLLKWQGRHFDWILAMWPVGGAVHLLNSRNTIVAKKDLAYCFDQKPLWVRFIVLISGALFNFIFAFLILTMLYMLGFTRYPALIQKFIPNSIAANAHLKNGDRIIAINNQEINSWNDAGMAFFININKKVNIITKYQQKTQKATLDLTQLNLQKSQESLLTQIGIDPRPLIKEKVPSLSIYPAMIKSMHAIFTHVYFYMISIKQLILRQIPFSILLGPIGLFVIATQSLHHGMILYFIATFSLAIGLANLLPLPGLDGGSVLYLLLEKVRKKPLSVAMEILLYRLAFIAFCVFIAQLIGNDIQRYFGEG